MTARLRSPVLTLSIAVICTLLSSCFVDGLWSWYDPDRVPDLEHTTDTLQVQEVRAPVEQGPVDRLALAVVPADEAPQTARIRRLGRAHEAWLQLERRPDVAAARGGALDEFVPLSYDLDVFDSSYLRRPTFNARLRSYGKIDRAVLGREVPAGEVPVEMRRRLIQLDPVLDGGLLGRVLDGFEAHDWLRLVGDQPQSSYARLTPVAFVTPGGDWLNNEQMLDALLGTNAANHLPPAERCRLLGRVDEPDGLTRFVTIPIPILLEAAELELLRRGDEVAFAHDQAWRGRFQIGPVASAWMPYSVPMRSDTIQYQWAAELPNDRPLLYALSTIATPVAVVLDFVLGSNVAIAELLRELFGPMLAPLGPKDRDTR